MVEVVDGFYNEFVMLELCSLNFMFDKVIEYVNLWIFGDWKKIKMIFKGFIELSGVFGNCFGNKFLLIYKFGFLF